MGNRFTARLVIVGLLVAGCTAVPRETAVVVPPTIPATIAPTDTADLPPATAVEQPAVEPTVIPTVRPTSVPAADPTDASQAPLPPIRTAVDQTTAVAAEAIAYVQHDQLFIRSLPDGEPITVHSEPCPSYCNLSYLKWSPEGRHLLYYYYDGSESSLRVADRQGNVQIITGVGFYRPGAWSPDGQMIAYLGDPPAAVWTIPLEDGLLGTPQQVGSWGWDDPGCGGGGRTISEMLYENEGGTSYGYNMGVTEWTPQDILLYNINCDNIGIGRFDMAGGNELPGYEQPLRNLVLNAGRDRWYAATGYAWEREEADNNQLVTGTPDSTEVTVIPTTAKVELVFSGRNSDALYYTERNPLMRDENFSDFQAALWRMQPDGSAEEQILASENASAYAQVEETADGGLLFVLVENERPLIAAVESLQQDKEALPAYFPQRHIMLQPAGDGEPMVILSDAGQPALSVP